MINWPEAVGRVIFNRIVLEAEALAPTPTDPRGRRVLY